MKRSPFLALGLVYTLSVNAAHAIAYPAGLTSNDQIDTTLNEAVYDLYVGGSTHSNIDYTLNADNSSIVIDGTQVRVGTTAWADTANLSNDGVSYDDNRVVQYSQLNAYGYNGDYGYGLVNGNSSGDSHTLDNYTGGADFDMVLFSFSEDVSLTGAAFTWIEGYDTGKQISVVGLNDISMFNNHQSNEFSWSDVANSAGTVLTSGHFNIATNFHQGGSHGNFSTEFSGLDVAKYWLVGAYNTHFDSNSNGHHGFGFKLASIGLSIDDTPDVVDPTPVSAPKTLAIFSSVLAFVIIRRRKTAR